MSITNEVSFFFLVCITSPNDKEISTTLKKLDKPMASFSLSLPIASLFIVTKTNKKHSEEIF